MNLSKEEKIVIEICKSEVSGKDGYNISHIAADDIDWQVILQIVKLNGIPYIFYHNLIKQKEILSKTPPCIIENLKEGYYYNLKQNILSLYELANIVKAMQAYQLDIIVLKGAALAETVYKNPALRAMSDIDILIQPDDFKIINKCFTNFGYKLLDKVNHTLPLKAAYLNTYTYKKDNEPFYFHVHWHLINSSIPTHSYTFKIDMNKIWDESVSVNIGGAKTLSLAPHHLVIHLSEHGLRVRHSFDKLVLLMDISKVISDNYKSLNWDRLVNDSINFNLDRMLYYSLLLCVEYFDVKLPDSVLCRLKPKHINIGEKYFLYMAQKNRRKPGLSYPIHFAMNKGFNNKARFIFRTIFPPKAIMDQRRLDKGWVNSLGRVGELTSHFLHMR